MEFRCRGAYLSSNPDLEFVPISFKKRKISNPVVTVMIGESPPLHSSTVPVKL